MHIKTDRRTEAERDGETETRGDRKSQRQIRKKGQGVTETERVVLELETQRETSTKRRTSERILRGEAPGGWAERSHRKGRAGGS